MHGMLWFTLILFSIVKTKIVHYSSFCYFPITYFAARFVIHQWENGFANNKRIHYFVLSFLVILAIVFGILGYLVGHTDLLLTYIHVNDPFAVQAMKERYDWSVLQLIPFGYSVIRSDRMQLWGQGLALNAISVMLDPDRNFISITPEAT